MKKALHYAGVRVVEELGYILAFWIFESCFIVALHIMNGLTIWAIPGMLLLNAGIVVAVSLVDSLINYLVELSNGME